MSQPIFTHPTQDTQPIIDALQSVAKGLSKSNNFYTIVADHTGAHSGLVFTQSHTLNKKEVSRIRLWTNHCEILFQPWQRKPVVFLPYGAISAIDHTIKVEPKNTRLYCSEKQG